MNYESIISPIVGISAKQVAATIALLDEKATIPFIARYRKELHGAMDDTALRTLAERLEYLRSLQERRETVKKSIEEQALADAKIQSALQGMKVVKAIVIKKKIVNFVAKPQ